MQQRSLSISAQFPQIHGSGAQWVASPLLTSSLPAPPPPLPPPPAVMMLEERAEDRRLREGSEIEMRRECEEGLSHSCEIEGSEKGRIKEGPL
eukprot:6201423-Pleurochrysis_carterae.AAC.3